MAITNAITRSITWPITAGFPRSPSSGGFSLNRYLASLNGGAVYFNAKLGSMYQEATGYTIADDVGEPVGLWLDQSSWNGKTKAQVLEEQPEKSGLSLTNGTNGTFFSGGIFPSGASIQAANTLNRIIVGSGVDAYGEYVELRVQGTNSGGAAVYPAIVFGAIAPAASTPQGEFNQYSVAIAIVAGSFSGFAGQTAIGVNEVTESNVYLTTVNSATSLTINSNYQRFDFISKVTNASAARSYPVLGLNVANGNTVDATFRVWKTSIKKLPGYHASQSTSNLKGTLQLDGVKFDANDDNLQSNYINGVTLGPELIVNGSFTTDTADWVKAATVTISGGTLNFAGAPPGTFAPAGQPYAFTAGRSYRVSYDVTVATAGGVRAAFANGTQATGLTRTAVGSYTEVITALSGNNTLFIQEVSTGFTGSVDNVSLREIIDQSNFYVALVSVPATIPSTQVIAGVNGGVQDRFFFGVSTLGNLFAGVGSATSQAVPIDIRNRTNVVVGISVDGTTVRLFVDETELSAAQASYINHTLPIRIGSFNANGVSSNTFGGSISKFVAGREFLTLDKFKQIRNSLLANS